MKYAILSDIHGNQYALAKVLKELDRLDISKLLLLGDYTGYYYGIESILEELGRYEVHMIRGNHEELLERCLKEPNFLTEIELKYGTSHRQCLQKLSNDQIEKLARLPEKLELHLNSTKVLLCHGAPWDMNDYIYPDADEETIQQFDKYDYDYIFYGHTHYACQFIRKDMKIINPGSVGQSRERGGVAYWGILDIIENEYTQMETLYDVDLLIKEVLINDPLLKYNYKVLRR